MNSKTRLAKARKVSRVVTVYFLNFAMINKKSISLCPLNFCHRWPKSLTTHKKFLTLPNERNTCYCTSKKKNRCFSYRPFYAHLPDDGRFLFYYWPELFRRKQPRRVSRCPFDGRSSGHDH